MVKVSASRGFTLFELLLVLLLLILVYGLAGPMLTGGSVGLEMKSAARQLAAGFRKARSLAAAERRETVLVIDVEARSFSVTGDAKRYPLPVSLNYSLFTAETELVRAQAGAIRFFPDGSSTGGRVTVSSGDNRLMIDVDWLTGRVAIL